MISAAALEKALVDFLPRQRWVGAGEGDLADVAVTRLDVLREGVPGMARALADVGLRDGTVARYQIFCGVRRPDDDLDFLQGKDHLLLGEHDDHGEPVRAYEALADPELALALLARVAPDEHVERVRAMNVEQTNTSVVYDDRLILKAFRRIADGPNPDAEVTRALADVGFDGVAPPVASWREDDTDYAVVNEYLAAGTDGWQLALTSLRDLYDVQSRPEEAGGNFAPEAHRLGAVTARLHLALAEAFGVSDADPDAWAADMERQHSRLPSGIDVNRERVAVAYRRLVGVRSPGPAIRVHGDYHLGQVMRTDSGWYVLDFEGEPARPLEERRRPSSPLRDVAGMLRSFHYAAHVALRDRGIPDGDELRSLAADWEALNRNAFLEGYLGADGVDAVLPAGDRSLTTVLAAFELDKAVYEIAYEMAHRPDWVGIPLEATARILEELS